MDKFQTEDKFVYIEMLINDYWNEMPLKVRFIFNQHNLSFY